MLFNKGIILLSDKIGKNKKKIDFSFYFIIVLDKATQMTHNRKRHRGCKIGRGDNVSLKGEKTKQLIRQKAYQLFAEKGFKEVTMKDICELTGLSRGGLYRHYESTEQIFLEIANAFSDKQKNEVFTKIEQHIPATAILEELLLKYANEMIDYGNSISLAIYEFYSSPAISKEENSIKKRYEISKSAWTALINYGIGTKEFKHVNPESIFHVIIFAYQGVRMYSKLMKMGEDIPAQITDEIKRLLLPEEVD